jgi:tetratricopeptide (TPR) repeat protein
MLRTFAITIAFATLAPRAVAAAEDRLVHELPPPAQFVATNDVTYAENSTTHAKLRFDIVRPRSTAGSAAAPVVIFLNGIGAPALRKHPQYSGWTRFVTSAGLAGVAMDSEDGAVEANFEALLAVLRTNARVWNVDPSRVAVFACSSNVSAGLPLIANPRHEAVKAAVIYYGSANVQEFRRDVPMLVVRAGLDFPGLNRGIDGVVTRALAANVPVTVIGLNGAHHAFDLVDDNDDSRAAMDATVSFFERSLRAGQIALRVKQSPEAVAAAALYAQDWPVSAARYGELVAAEPQRSSLRLKLAEALAGTGDSAGALASYRKALELGDPNVGLISAASARLALRLNDRDEAFRWLQNVRGDAFAGFRRNLKNDPAFAPLRDDPRFTDIFGP